MQKDLHSMPIRAHVAQKNTFIWTSNNWAWLTMLSKARYIYLFHVLGKSRRRYMAEILPIRRKTLSNQSIIVKIPFVLNFLLFYVQNKGYIIWIIIINKICNLIKNPSCNVWIALSLQKDTNSKIKVQFTYTSLSTDYRKDDWIQ